MPKQICPLLLFFLNRFAHSPFCPSIQGLPSWILLVDIFAIQFHVGLLKDGQLHHASSWDWSGLVQIALARFNSCWVNRRGFCKSLEDSIHRRFSKSAVYNLHKRDIWPREGIKADSSLQLINYSIVGHGKESANVIRLRPILAKTGNAPPRAYWTATPSDWSP